MILRVELQVKFEVSEAADWRETVVYGLANGTGELVWGEACQPLLILALLRRLLEVVLAEATQMRMMLAVGHDGASAGVSIQEARIRVVGDDLHDIFLFELVDLGIGVDLIFHINISFLEGSWVLLELLVALSTAHLICFDVDERGAEVVLLISELLR